ncbi:hypothetical protein BaRGS_00000345, partial [Batillaria attramentaria]
CLSVDPSKRQFERTSRQRHCHGRWATAIELHRNASLTEDAAAHLLNKTALKMHQSCTKEELPRCCSLRQERDGRQGSGRTREKETIQPKTPNREMARILRRGTVMLRTYGVTAGLRSEMVYAPAASRLY